MVVDDIEDQRANRGTEGLVERCLPVKALILIAREERSEGSAARVDPNKEVCRGPVNKWRMKEFSLVWRNAGYYGKRLVWAPLA